jgi:hypothetical protein
MYLIDYGHVRDGVLYHGTISRTEGGPKATWTYEDGGEKVTRDQPVDDGTFALLWNGVAEFGVFRRCMAQGPDTPIDPVTHHVIGIVFREDGQQGHYLFLVPAGETDPDFVRWLEALSVPGGSDS